MMVTGGWIWWSHKTGRNETFQEQRRKTRLAGAIEGTAREPGSGWSNVAAEVRRTLRAGSGNSRRFRLLVARERCQVMSTPEPPTQIWVRWPGGKVTTAEITRTAKEIALDQTGRLEFIR